MKRQLYKSFICDGSPRKDTMKPITYITAIAILTACIGTPSLAGDRPQEQGTQKTTKMRPASGYDHGMQVVANNAAPNTPGYGWRYFSDPVTRRAVVISPQGDYYYSRGKGLQWIAAEQLES